MGYTPLFGGFSPMTADGYGVCYAQLEGRMNLMLTAWRSCEETSAIRLRDTLEACLIDMRGLGARAAAAASSKL